MTQTLRRELRKKIMDVLEEALSDERDILDDTPGWTEKTADKLADAVLEIKGFHRTNLPIDWKIAAGMTSEEIEQDNKKLSAEKEILDHYEKEMVFNPLSWYSDKKLDRLRRFLLGKTKEEITAFADWCKREYSSFSPAKARQYPELVIDLFPQSQPEKPKSSFERLMEQAREEQNKPIDEGFTVHVED